MRQSPWLLIFVLLPNLTLAAPPEGRNEIAFQLGASLLDVEKEFAGPRIVPEIPVPVSLRQRRSIGGSFLVGFRVGHYVGKRAQIEAAFQVAPAHEFRRAIRFECPRGDFCPVLNARPRESVEESKLPAYHYDLNLSFDLAEGQARPFLTFGVGGVSYDAPERAETDFAFNVGAGLKMYFGNVGARIELGDHIIPNHFLTGKAEHDVQVRGGLVLRLH